MPATIRDLGQELARLSRTLHQLRAHLAADAPGGMQWSTFTLLLHLVTSGPQRLRDLAGLVCVDPSTASRQIDQLVRHGLVERRPDPDDGRAALLAATEAGLAAARTMRERRDAYLADVLADWDAADLAAFASLLARFNDDLIGTAPLAPARRDAVVENA